MLWVINFCLLKTASTVARSYLWALICREDWALLCAGTSILGGQGPQYFANVAMHQSYAATRILPYQSVIKIMKCTYCLNCPKFVQLIIRKIIRIVTTRCQIFGCLCVKMYKIRFRLGLRPRPTFGSLARPWPLAAFMGPYFKGGEGRESKRKKKWASKKEFGPPNLQHRSTPRTVSECSDFKSPIRLLSECQRQSNDWWRLEKAG